MIFEIQEWKTAQGRVCKTTKAVFHTKISKITFSVIQKKGSKNQIPLLYFILMEKFLSHDIRSVAKHQNMEGQ